METMKRCTSHSEKWPDSIDQVAPEKLDDYLVHAEACAYHEQSLLAEDEGLRSMFKLARGLDPEARILFDTELEDAVGEHRRRRARWAEEVSKKQMPFTRLALRNA